MKCLVCLEIGTRRICRPRGCSGKPSYVRRIPREPLVKRVENNYCVIEKPIKAVYPKAICHYIDQLIQGTPLRLLLLGPPGVGKSLLGRILSRTAPFNVIEVEPESLLSRYVGEAEAHLKNIFNTCISSQPCLLFIDEADLLIQQRGSGGEGYGDVSDSLIRLFLRFLQSTTDQGYDIAVVAASNKPARDIDSAILRRFTQVYVPLLDVEGVQVLGSLYGKEIGREEAVKLINKAVTTSNILHYLKTGELKEYQLTGYARSLYLGSYKLFMKRRGGVKIIVAEKPPVGIVLATLVLNSLTGKPALVVEDPRGIKDVYHLAKASNMPVVVPFFHYHLDEVMMYLTDREIDVALAGPEWDFSIERFDLPKLRSQFEDWDEVLEGIGCSGYDYDDLEKCLSGFTFS